ncbi:TadE/TadG family type IV pilus assembly protein [Bradyrhizobium sp.]|uniref:TadE/TadG family type IV pilus assembly protein n=1 Tax=Bradyrhizobium sp. TaxID=376 RepID=UPI001DB90AB4|nr:pilus assembly protein TadG-related protein [Bradyrhizobium sp.]MBV8696285.1 pilus assembly protein [Bradyrhizobium sp.]MBV8916476.1 pilus assembly protein [Bradyrhizobium sp.]
MFHDFISRFLRQREGNVAITFALCIVPIVFLIGMALDYASAIARQQRLNAAADSAALAAVSPSLMSQSTTQAQTVATNVFSAQASAVSGVTYDPPTISVTQNGLARSATVSFTASSANVFPNVLGKTSWPLSGTTTAGATSAANIDFYLMLDNSPSMALAATTAGVNTMLANTPQQGNGNGCAFACHQSNPNSTDTPGNPAGWDNYKLAQSLGVVTRIQNLATATKSLTSTATSMAAQTAAMFRMGVYTFNTSNLGNTLTTVQSLTTNLAQAGTAASGVDVFETYIQDYVTSSMFDDDTDTDFAAALSSMNSVMTTPGTGASGSSPQAVLFLVTDGVEDKQATSCTQPLKTRKGISRCIQPVDITTCATIKSRGIKIAVLYTEFVPLPNDSFYKKYIAPFQSSIGPNLQSCASPGLYFGITTDDDITVAMTTLFNNAVQSIEAHLSN